REAAAESPRVPAMSPQCPTPGPGRAHRRARPRLARRPPASAPTPAARKPGPAPRMISKGHRLWEVESDAVSWMTLASTTAGTDAPTTSTVGQKRVAETTRGTAARQATMMRGRPQTAFGNESCAYGICQYGNPTERNAQANAAARTRRFPDGMAECPRGA